MVTLCTDMYDLSKPLEGNRYNNGGRIPNFDTNLIAWSRACKRIHIHDYLFNFAYYWHAFPSLQVLGPNYRFFADHGVRHLHAEGAHSRHARQIESAEIKLWMAAHLLWDPYKDKKPLLDRFFSRFFFRNRCDILICRF